MTQTTSTSTMTRTPTRASCTCEHGTQSAQSPSFMMSESYTPHWLKIFMCLTSSHLHTCAFLLDLTFFPFYFDLSFPVFFHFSLLLHPVPHIDLNNLNSMQHNLRTSAKGSNDAYDVTFSFTVFADKFVDENTYTFDR